jgi:pimeloyl-ACP methyl ester carboxylesterase
MLTIIAIHGNGGGGFRFERVLPYMPEDVCLKPITLPGFADVPRNPKLRTMRDYADYLHSVIIEEARPVVALGTGIGGAILLEYVQHYTNTLNGVILHAPVGTRLDERRFPQFMNLPFARTFGQWLISARVTRPLFKRLLFQDYTRIPAEYLDRFFKEYRQCAVFGEMFDIITPAWYNNLKPSPIPSALLWGERERVLNVNHVEDYQKLLPNSTVRIVPGWDHFPMIEEPEVYAQEIVTLAKRF